jgi:hypothetical protein
MISRIIALLGVFVLACVGTLYAISNPGKAVLHGTGDSAAWIQAWWSIAGITIALAAPGLEAELKARAEYDRKKRLLGLIVRFADAHLALATGAKDSDEMARNFQGAERTPRFEEARDALASFPVTVFRTVQEAQDLMLLRSAMAEAVALLNRADSGSLNYQRALVLVDYQRRKASLAIGNLKGNDKDFVPPVAEGRWQKLRRVFHFSRLV